MAEEFPTDWREEPCYIVAIPLPLIKYVGGMLKMLEQRGFWASPEDYERAYTATVELEGCLMATCLSDLIEGQNALYRMVNTALFGVTYETVSTDPLVVTPAIAPHVTLDIHDYESIQGRLEDLKQMLDNALTGSATPHYDNAPSIRQQLDDILAAIGSDDTDIEGILTAVQAIATLVA